MKTRGSITSGPDFNDQINCTEYGYENSIKRWTQSEVNRVARLITEGKRPDQIALAEDLSGRTPAAISNLIYKDEVLLKLYQSNRDKRTLRLPQGDRTAHGRPVKQSAKKLLKDLSAADENDRI